MHPLVPYLLGEKHPAGTRLTDYQKCVRTGDIEEVGDPSHLTCFEMLGNWSLGDYFKKESIAFSYEFLTSPKWLALDPRKISVTVFAGDENAPRDEEAASYWKENGMPEDKIAYLPASDNWWAAGPTGPCGPDTEIFYWVGEGLPPAGSNKGTDSANWMEIWNNVFMQYNRVDEKTLVPLPKKNVDTFRGKHRSISRRFSSPSSKKSRIWRPTSTETTRKRTSRFESSPTTPGRACSFWETKRASRRRMWGRAMFCEGSSDALSATE